MKLYEIANSYQQVLQLAEAGELDSQTAKDTLESISGEFAEKAKNAVNSAVPMVDTGSI